MKFLRLAIFSLPQNKFLDLIHFIVPTDRPGVKEVSEIQQLNDRILSALKLEMGQNHPGDENILKRFVEQAGVLRSLSTRHIRVLNAFKEEAPDIDFPALHKELFSIETESGSPNMAGCPPQYVDPGLKGE